VSSSTSLHGKKRWRFVFVAVVLVVGLTLLLSSGRWRNETSSGAVETAGQSKGSSDVLYLTPEQWARLKIEAASKHVFWTTVRTEGKISLNEDKSTPIFSPFAGRVTKLLAQPGDAVTQGQPLFVIEAADMVQAQNDFMSAVSAVNKAKTALAYANIVEKQNRRLYDSGNAVALRDLQQAQAALDAAQNDLRAAEAAMEAARNRLRILGRTDEEINSFQDTGVINPETPIQAPISGTVVQRRVGPGQYVSYTSTGSTEPIYIIGDLSTVWLVAYVRESDAVKVRVGQPLEFTVLSIPDRVFRANITYVGALLDPATRRLLVRALVRNQEGILKPEMFASVKIFIEEGDSTAAVNRNAIVYEGENAHVWVVRDHESIQYRKVKTGMSEGDLVQIVEGLSPGERVVSKGTLFVERAAGN
jgi:cobalt-zinc-cadmium efflux system membrane fusion protein